MKATTQAIIDDVEEGLFTKGAQVSVLVGGETRLQLAIGDDGLGRPLTRETVFRVYCTTKPICTIAVATQVQAGTLDLDQPLSDKLPGVQALADGSVTLRHVLTHTAGLHRPMGVELELVAPDKRAAFLDRYERPGGWAVGRRASYSEVFGWHLLGRLLEQATGEPLRDHLRSSLLDPLGLHDTWIGMTPQEHDALLPRLGVGVDLRRQPPIPLLLERGQRLCTDVNPAHGGYTTTTDLARFYALLLAQLEGADHPALPSADTLRTFTTSSGPARFDEMLDRECTYGLGFMTALAGHAFGTRCSPASFGHSGNVGSSFGFADPDRDLAVAVTYNGVVDPESAFLRRPALVRSIYADLDAEADAANPDTNNEQAAVPAHARRRFRRRSLGS